MRHRIFNDRAAQTVNPFNQIGGDDLLRRPLGDDPAVAQGDQVGGVAAGLVKIVQHRRRGIALLAIQLTQQFQQVDLMADVQPVVGSSSSIIAVSSGQHHRNPRPLPLAAGKRVDALQRQIADPGRSHRLVHRLFIFFAPAVNSGWCG